MRGEIISDRTPASDRQALRAALLGARTGMPEDEYGKASQALEALLERVLMKLKPDLLGLYWPFKREFDVIPLATRYLVSGGRAALPVVVGRQHPLDYRMWHPGCDLAVDRMGISYPALGDPVSPDWLLVPMVGFDAHGYRLGYGGGYFDRTLAVPNRPRTIGVAFEVARTDAFIPQAHDIPMDLVVTERRVTVHTPEFAPRISV